MGSFQRDWSDKVEDVFIENDLIKELGLTKN